MNLNENHHHLQPEKQTAMYHFENHPLYHQSAYTQPCQMFIDHNKHPTITATAHNIQATAHHTQVIAHHNQSTTHNAQTVAHHVQATTHNIQTIAHLSQPHITHATSHHIQTPVHNIQPSTHNTQTTAHHIQTTAHNNQLPAHITQSTAIHAQPTVNNSHTPAENSQSEVVQNEAPVQPQDKEAVTSNNRGKTEVKADPETSALKTEKRLKAIGKSKNSVDTSHFTIEERLIAAVWVHERKNIKKSMRQLKHDFHQRFGRKAPAKNTLLGWERKLFSTGCLEDAPRTGRPVKRRSRVEEVAASIRAAPALSLRARALALRVPTTTLHTILRRDLAQHTTTNNKSTHGTTMAEHDIGKTPTKKSSKKAKPTKRKTDAPLDQGVQSTNVSLERAPNVFNETMAMPLC